MTMTPWSRSANGYTRLPFQLCGNETRGHWAGNSPRLEVLCHRHTNGTRLQEVHEGHAGAISVVRLHYASLVSDVAHKHIQMPRILECETCTQVQQVVARSIEARGVSRRVDKLGGTRTDITPVRADIAHEGLRQREVLLDVEVAGEPR